MHWAFDLDNTLDIAPAAMQSLLGALKAAAHQITIVTGSSDPVPDATVWGNKQEYLRANGFDSLYHWLVVIGDPPHQRKADFCANGGWALGVHGKRERVPKVDVLVDNSLQNARLASKHSLVLVPWNAVQD